MSDENPEEKQKELMNDSEFREHWKTLSEDEKKIARRTMGSSGL